MKDNNSHVSYTQRALNVLDSWRAMLIVISTWLSCCISTCNAKCWLM